MSGLVVGVDGGGSKTLALVGTAEGDELASAEGPGSAVAPGKAEHSASVIAATVREALSRVEGHDATDVQVLYCGVAGVGRETEQKRLQQALESMELAAEVVVEPDALVAMYDAFGDAAGILLIAGTGSIAFGRAHTGAVVRAGGWGPAFGDEGSGGWIGRRALGIVAAAADGREAPTSLLGAVLTATQCTTPDDLIAWAAAANTRTIAGLAPVVMSTASAGDPRADALVSLAAEELLVHIRALARQLFGDERTAIPVALVGGLMKKGSLLRKRLEQRLRSAIPGAQIRAEEVRPARGALRAAVARTHLPTSP